VSIIVFFLKISRCPLLSPSEYGTLWFASAAATVDFSSAILPASHTGDDDVCVRHVQVSLKRMLS
jgi:hypothetical protein